MKKRAWFITIDRDGEHESYIPNDEQLRNNCTYYACGHHVGRQSKRRHTHYYVHLRGPRTITFLKNIFSCPWLHADAARGTADDAIRYIGKNNTVNVVEYGTKPKQGRRTDLEECKNLLANGGSMLDVLNAYPSQYIRYSTGLQRAANLLRRERAKAWRNITTTVFIGETGLGKSRRVYDECAERNCQVFTLSKGNTGVWFDGYEQEEVLLIDDFYGWISYGHLLNILDGHPLRIDIKSSHGWALYTRVYITSNKPPTKWYSHGLTPALRRRLTSILKISEGDSDCEMCDLDEETINSLF